MLLRVGNKENIIKLLQKRPDGLTISDLAKELRLSRNTIVVVLAELKGAGKVRMRPIGMAKLYYWEGGK